jgi:hypothetical protein
VIRRAFPLLDAIITSVMTPIITLSCLIDGWALAAESGFPPRRGSMASSQHFS